MSEEIPTELSPSCLLGNHDFNLQRIENQNHCSIYYECTFCNETIIADICWIHHGNNDKKWLFQIPKVDSDGKVRPSVLQVSTAHMIR